MTSEGSDTEFHKMPKDPSRELGWFQGGLGLTIRLILGLHRDGKVLMHHGDKNG